MNGVDLNSVLNKIPLLAEIPVRKLRIRPLPGLTNLNYHIRHGQNDYVLRIPGKHTTGLIDRRQETLNTELAIRLNLAPEVLWRDETGLCLTQCVRDSRNLVKDDFNDREVLLSLIDKLAVLHCSGPAFKGRTDIDKLLRAHFDLMPANRQKFLSERFETGLRISRIIAETDNRPVASHNDLVLENILIDKARKLWLIDWEYSSLSSPYWDIATICNNARLVHRQCQHLLSLYNDRIDKLRLENLFGYQYMLQLLTISWLAVYTNEPIETEIGWLDQLKLSANHF